MQLFLVLKTIRQKAFMTQVAFANRLGVTPSTINRWEHGKAKPNLTAMKKLKELCEENGLDYGSIESAWFGIECSK